MKFLIEKHGANNVVHVKVQGIRPETSGATLHQIGILAGTSPWTSSTSGGVLDVGIGNVSNIEQLAAKIKFGRILQTDKTRRLILVDLPSAPPPQSQHETKVAAANDQPAERDRLPERMSSPQARAVEPEVRVTSQVSLEVGMTLWAQWAQRWYAVQVLEVMPQDKVKVHWVEWNSAFDEVLPRNRLWLDPMHGDAPDSSGTESVNSVEPATANEAQIRTWTDATGKHQIEARLVEAKDGRVVLERVDGKVVSLSIEKLSKQDQDVIREHTLSSDQRK